MGQGLYREQESSHLMGPDHTASVCVCTDLHISHFTQYVYSTNVPFFFLIKEEINQTQTVGNVSDASRVENNF